MPPGADYFFGRQQIFYDVLRVLQMGKPQGHTGCRCVRNRLLRSALLPATCAAPSNPWNPVPRADAQPGFPRLENGSERYYTELFGAET